MYVTQLRPLSLIFCLFVYLLFVCCCCFGGRVFCFCFLLFCIISCPNGEIFKGSLSLWAHLHMVAKTTRPLSTLLCSDCLYCYIVHASLHLLHKLSQQISIFLSTLISVLCSDTPFTLFLIAQSPLYNSVFSVLCSVEINLPYIVL